MAQFRKVLVFVCMLVFLMAVTFATESTPSAETTAASGSSPEPETSATTTDGKTGVASAVAYSLTVLAASAIYSLFL
ncbi:hypothetical protein NP493_2349g00006 [Ridgeia piscesae]|uniref:Uncharacterized protein n=1 Tax=Ridgeia piscesae TaxID=27915 RepID=A0AAD9JH85_RIDPI|nr:hypothetical protein NP493_2349g00006 [Ridgeia piscesae]